MFCFAFYIRDLNNQPLLISVESKSLFVVVNVVFIEVTLKVYETMKEREYLNLNSPSLINVIHENPFSLKDLHEAKPYTLTSLFDLFFFYSLFSDVQRMYNFMTFSLV